MTETYKEQFRRKWAEMEKQKSNSSPNTHSEPKTKEPKPTKRK